MIFLDKLSLKSFFIIACFLYRKKLLFKSNEIFVLDDINKDIRTSIIFLLCYFLGFSFKNIDFFSGDYRDSNGESLWSVSKRILNKLSFDSASLSIAKSVDAKALNSQWGSNTILLHLSKKIFSQLWYSDESTISKILVTEAMAKEKEIEKYFLFIALPELVEENNLTNHFPKIELKFYKNRINNIYQIRFNVLLVGARHLFKKIYYLLKNLFQNTKQIRAPSGSSNLMIIQSDEISYDRSLRTQPHWIFDHDEKSKYETYILERPGFTNDKKNDLKNHHNQEIRIISEHDLYLLRTKYDHSTKMLLKSFMTCLRMSFFGDEKEIQMSFYFAKLFENALLMFLACKKMKIAVCMTAENFPLEADAIQLIKRLRSLKTISYQYSNMSETTPVMMNTSDLFLTFSTKFQAKWRNKYVSPSKFMNIGYCFDGSFNLLRERSLKLRTDLHNKGVKHILCYFDESVQSNKYGVISLQQYVYEIEKLSEMILSNPNLALIVKPQFSFNSSMNLDLRSNNFYEAVKSGRLIEIYQGSHRNTIFPAEAALSSDIAIGHAIGSTASLESALVGCRSILINPNDIRGSNIELYEEAKIIFSSIDDAIESSIAFINDPEQNPNFGIWDKIIKKFDPFRDGNSSHRIKKAIWTSIQP
jgi:hypothetical protein